MFDFRDNKLSPWDHGALHAHRICAGPTRVIHRCLRSAKRRRRGVLALIFKNRRRYLDGLIEGLEKEIKIRERDKV